MTEKRGNSLTKRVEFVAKDAAEQVATGIVMVPDKVDLQGDYAREDTIRSFAGQFKALHESGDASGGIMHAVWPDEWLSLERNEVLDEATTIGGEEAPAGSWIQSWQFADDDVWGLVEDGVLEGYSIGARDVAWDGPVEDREDLPDDVSVADAYDGEMGFWELTDGIVREVSLVDIPAVPDAEILEAKADAAKRLADHLGNQDAFIEEALDRGHSEAEAERLWAVLNRAVEVEGAGTPGEKASLLERVGKAAVGVLSGSDDGRDAVPPEDLDSAGATVAATPDTDPRRKEGRTLSKQNEHDLKAVMDAAASVFRDAGRDPGFTRFTDREGDEFDLSEHEARAFDDEDEDGLGLDDVVEGSDGKNASGSDIPDDTDMSNDDTPMADAPEWAKALNDRIDDLEASDGGEGETNTDKDGGDGPLADAPEWAKALDERISDVEDKALDDDGGEGGEDKPEWAKDLEARVDTIVEQSGGSQQLAGHSENGDGEDVDAMDDLTAALS